MHTCENKPGEIDETANEIENEEFDEEENEECREIPNLIHTKTKYSDEWSYVRNRRKMDDVIARSHPFFSVWNLITTECIKYCHNWPMLKCILYNIHIKYEKNQLHFCDYECQSSVTAPVKAIFTWHSWLANYVAYIGYDKPFESMLKMGYPQNVYQGLNPDLGYSVSRELVRLLSVARCDKEVGHKLYDIIKEELGGSFAGLWSADQEEVQQLLVDFLRNRCNPDTNIEPQALLYFLEQMPRQGWLHNRMQCNRRRYQEISLVGGFSYKSGLILEILTEMERELRKRNDCCIVKACNPVREEAKRSPNPFLDRIDMPRSACDKRPLPYSFSLNMNEKDYDQAWLREIEANYRQTAPDRDCVPCGKRTMERVPFTRKCQEN